MKLEYFAASFVLAAAAEFMPLANMPLRTFPVDDHWSVNGVVAHACGSVFGDEFFIRADEKIFHVQLPMYAQHSFDEGDQVTLQSTKSQTLIEHHRSDREQCSFPERAYDVEEFDLYSP